MIDADGKQIGIVPFTEALLKAQERQLDLIQVTEHVDPPVCKIGDYGKYLYQLEKKAREAKKPTAGEVKEVRLTFTISSHDLETRATQAKKFLERGYVVRVTLPLRGRQRFLEQFAIQKVNTFLHMVSSSLPIKVERELRREPRGLSLIIGK